MQVDYVFVATLFSFPLGLASAYYIVAQDRRHRPFHYAIEHNSHTGWYNHNAYTH